MRNIRSITIFCPDKVKTFAVGSKIIANGIETTVTVERITCVYFFRFTKVHLSNGNSFVYSGLPFIADHGDNPF